MEPGVLSNIYKGTADAFDLGNTALYNLYFQIDANTIRACAVHSQSEEVLLLRCYVRQEKEDLATKLDQLLRTDAVLSQADWENISVGLNISNTLFIPQSVFDYEEIPKWWNLNSTTLETEFSTEKSDVLGAFAVSPKAVQIQKILSEKYPGATFCLAQTKWLEAAVRNAKFNTAPRFYVDMGNETIDIAVAWKGKLLLANRFEMRAADDMLYHVSNIKTQLCPEQNIEIMLSGFVDVIDPIFSQLKNFFGNARINFGMEVYKYGTGLSQVPKQAFVLTQNLIK